MRFHTKAPLALAAVILTAVPIWAKVNIDHLANRCDAGKRNACRELAKLAEQDKDTAVRLEAIRKLNDRTVLARVALADKDESVRKAAARSLAATGYTGPLNLTGVDQTLLAQLAEYAPFTDAVVQAVGRLTDQTLLAQVAIKTDSYYVRLLATEKLPDEVLNQIDEDNQETEDFKDAIRNDTVQSLSGFIKHHPSGIRVGRAFAEIWRILLSEFPAERFNCSENYFRIVYPNEQGSYLFAAIETNRSFVVAFSPKTRGSFTVQFRELAGQPVTIDHVVPVLGGHFVTTDYYNKLSNSGEISVLVPAYGRGSYEWPFNDFGGILKFLSFQSTPSTLTIFLPIGYPP